MSEHYKHFVILSPVSQHPLFSSSKQVLFKNGHQVALEVDVNSVRHLQGRRENDKCSKPALNVKKIFFPLLLFIPPPSCASPARDGAPSPSAGRGHSVQLRRRGVGLVVVGVEPVGSASVG